MNNNFNTIQIANILSDDGRESSKQSKQSFKIKSNGKSISRPQSNFGSIRSENRQIGTKSAADDVQRVVTNSKLTTDNLKLEEQSKAPTKRAASPRRTLQHGRVLSGLTQQHNKLKHMESLSLSRKKSINSGEEEANKKNQPHRRHTSNVMQIRSQMQSLLQAQDFNLKRLSLQLDISPQHTKQLIGLINNDQDQLFGSNMGRSSASILQKNPIFKVLRKFFRQDKQIKNVMAVQKELNKIIDNIKPLENLCNPSKNRLRNLMQMQQIEQQGIIPVTDVQNGDLIYIDKGCLEVCFETLSYKPFDIATSPGNQRSQSPPNKRIDRVIKYVKCVPYDPKTEIPLRERVPIQQFQSKKNLRNQQSNNQQTQPRQGSQQDTTPAKDSTGAFKKGSASQPQSSLNSSSSQLETDSEAENEIDPRKEAEQLWNLLSLKLKKINNKSKNNDLERQSTGKLSSSNTKNSQATMSCTFVKIPYATYKKFVDYPAGKNQRNIQNMTLILRNTMPYFGNILVKKGLTILDEFEEVEYFGGPGGFRPGTILEHEGKQCEYLYLILQGEIHFYKRILGLYSEVEMSQPGQPFKVGQKIMNVDNNRPLENFINLKESNNKQIGMFLGTLRGTYDPNDDTLNQNIIAGDDSSLFFQPNNYSLVAGDNTLLFRVHVKTAFQIWPPDTLRQLRANVTEKYAWLRHRQNNIEAQLFKNPKNKTILDITKKVDDRTNTNYPNANQRAQQVLKDDNMRVAQGNEQVYLGLQNRRIQSHYNQTTNEENGLISVRHHKADGTPQLQIIKDKQTLIIKDRKGAVNEQLIKRLERLKNIHITGQKDFCYFRSETLEQLASNLDNQLKSDSKRKSEIPQLKTSAMDTLTKNEGNLYTTLKKQKQKNSQTRSSQKDPLQLQLQKISQFMHNGPKTQKFSQNSRSNQLQVAATFVKNKKKYSIIRTKPNSAAQSQTNMEKLKTMRDSSTVNGIQQINRQFSKVSHIDKSRFKQQQSNQIDQSVSQTQQTNLRSDTQTDNLQQINVIALNGTVDQQFLNNQAIINSSSKSKFRNVSISPSIGGNKTQNEQYPSMLNAIDKRESMSFNRGSSAQIANFQNNISFQNDSKVSYQYPTNEKIEFLNQMTQNVQSDLLNETGMFQSIPERQQKADQSQLLQSPKYQNIDFLRAEHSIGKASQDSASIQCNDKFIMSSKNMNTDETKHQKNIRDQVYSNKSNSKSFGSPGTFNSTAQQLEYKMHGNNYKFMLSNHNSFKSRSSEYIMSNATINAINDRKRRSHNINNNVPNNQVNSQIYVASIPGTTPKSVNQNQLQKNFSVPRQQAPTQKSVHRVMDSGTFTIMNSVQRQNSKPSSQTRHQPNLNDIRPGSIYSSHQHARRKFQIQQNIRTNRNHLVMQTQMINKLSNSVNFKSSRQTRKQNLNIETRPQTQGTIQKNNFQLLKGFNTQMQPFSATNQARNSMNKQLIDDIADKQYNQIAVNGLLLNHHFQGEHISFYDPTMLYPQLPTNVQVKQINDDQGLISNTVGSLAQGQEKSTRSCAVADQRDTIV